MCVSHEKVRSGKIDTQPVSKGICMMMKIGNESFGKIDDLAFTKEELDELNRAREMPIVFDEDCPETTPESATKFRRVNPIRRKGKINAEATASAESRYRGHLSQ